MSKLIIFFTLLFVSGCVSQAALRLGFYSVDKRIETIQSEFSMGPLSPFSGQVNGVETRANIVKRFIAGVDQVQKIYKPGFEWTNVARQARADEVYVSLLISAVKRFAKIENLPKKFEIEVFKPISDTELYLEANSKFERNNLIDSCLIWIGANGDGCTNAWRNESRLTIERLSNDTLMVMHGTNPEFWKRLAEAQKDIRGSALGHYIRLEDNGRNIKIVKSALGDEGQESFELWKGSIPRALKVHKHFLHARLLKHSKKPFLRNSSIWNPTSGKAYMLTEYQLTQVYKAVEASSGEGEFHIDEASLYLVHNGKKQLLIKLASSSQLSTQEMDALGGWQTR